VTTDPPSLEPLAADRVGVFAWVTGAGHPSACAVTPYLVDGHAVVTSTAALVSKAAAVRRDDRTALLAGGLRVVGRGVVGFDPTPHWFDAHLRGAELEKYPPARTLLAVPDHRRLLPWYVARAVVRIEPSSVVPVPTGHRASITVLDHEGRLRLEPLTAEVDAHGERVAVGHDLPDGRAVLLIHEEDERMLDLRQRRLFGTVHEGVLHVERHDGSLDPSSAGTLDQLRTLRLLGRRARANRERLAGWPLPDRCRRPDHTGDTVASGS
jgi:hypothetical protein